MDASQLWLIIGLGNPGASYAGHRHNIGFMAVDALAQAYGFRTDTRKFNALTYRGRIGNHEILALKPQTFMNLSGQSVGEAARFFKIPPERVIVLHDELDLPAGKLRVKQGGGHGGHNGLKDIDRAIGQNYWRLRLGIGHPGRKEMVHGYVLSDFTSTEWPLQFALIDATVKHFPHMFATEPEKLMTAVALQLHDNG